MKSFTNTRLLLLLGLLVVAYAIIELTGGKSRSDAFKKDLVTFENEKVDRLTIEKEGKVLQLTKSNNQWKVKTEKGFEVEAEASKVENALGMLKEIVPSRVAAKDDSKWAEFQVDTAGTKVQVFAEGKKALDIILGKFSVVNQRQFNSYVRLTDDPIVYTVDNFMSMSFPSASGGYRNGNLLRFNRDSVQEISFVYPADSSFVLSKSDGAWRIDSKEVDAKKVNDFIGAINYKTSTDFEDSIEKSSLGAPLFSLILKVAGEDGPLSLDAYQHESFKWVLNSSQNEKAWFTDSDESELKKFFKGRNSF